MFCHVSPVKRLFDLVLPMASYYLFYITGHKRTKRAGTMWGELDRKLEWVKTRLNTGINKIIFFIQDRLILKFTTAEFYFFVKFFDYPFTLL